MSGMQLAGLTARAVQRCKRRTQLGSENLLRKPHDVRATG